MRLSHWVVCVVVSLFGSHKLAAEKSEGSVVGAVFDAASGIPLPGTSVRVGDREAVCDDAGAFELFVPMGSYVLQVNRPDGGTSNVVDVPVVHAQSTNVVIRLRSDGAVSADIEAPPGAVVGANAGSVEAQKPVARVELHGTVVSLDDGAVIGGARLFVRGAADEGRTDDRGHFTLELPPGEYDLTVVHGDFASAAVNAVTVAAGTPELRIEMVPKASTLGEMVVRTPHVSGSTAGLMAERRDASGVTDVIGAAEMSKTGDSSAAGALRRVTGVTLVEGRYVYVRGLGERYSSTLMNDATLPSPEPERRVVPLDLFPSGLLDSIVVQKSYTPDLPGSFGGGAVVLRTRNLPESFEANFSISAAAVQYTTGELGPMYQGGSTDWLGYDGGFRSLPEEVKEATKDQKLVGYDRWGLSGYSEAELLRLGRLMPNHWSTQRQTVRPNLGVSFSVGDRLKVGDRAAGYSLSGSFGNDWLHTRKRERFYTSNNGVEERHSYRFNTLTNTIGASLMGAVGMEVSPQFKLSATALVVRLTDNETRSFRGYNADVDADIAVTRLRWVERMLSVNQIRGEHTFGADSESKVDWRYTLSIATRDEPDRREIRYDHEPGTDLWFLSDRPEGNQRLFSDLLDTNHDVALDVTAPVRLGAAITGKLKAGSQLVYKNRGVDTRRFKFLHMATTDADRLRPPETIFAPENISPGFQLGEITRPTDNYDAKQTVVGAYALADLELATGIRLLAGARLEWASHWVGTYELFEYPSNPIVSSDDVLDVLPAVNLSIEVGADAFVRVTASQTVSRPDFRELSPATFDDVVGARQITGNPDLHRTRIDSVDARWEWYPSAEESLSLGAFAQRFIDPIESVVIPSAQLSLQPQNTKGARNLGIELEFRKTLAFITPLLADTYVQSNLSLIRSRIEIEKTKFTVETSQVRPLQGQSPYVLNVQVGYDGTDNGYTAAVVYNVFGERISGVGALGLPDTYEQPFHELNVVLMKRFDSGFRLAAKGKNLLASTQRSRIGSVNASVERRPFAVSMSLGYAF